MAICPTGGCSIVESNLTAWKKSAIMEEHSRMLARIVQLPSGAKVAYYLLKSLLPQPQPRFGYNQS